MRIIDADAMMAELKPITFEMEHSAVTIADMSNIMRSWVERQPTLTPQNEALTWNELETMTDNPIYIVELERPNRCYWALVHQVSESGVMLTSAIELNDYGSHELYGQSWLAYRNPPERQEDT